MENAFHKFKTTVRTKLRIWKDDACLVCVDGGVGSMCMLDLLKKCINESTRKKIFMNITVIHIDESVVYPSNPNLVKDLCEKYSFNYIIVPLEHIFTLEEFLLPTKIADTQITVIKRVPKSQRKVKSPEEEKAPSFTPPETETLTSSEESKLKLKQFISCFDIQSKHEIITYLKRWVLMYYARKYKFTKVLLSHNANALAAHLFQLTISGRGQNMASDAEYADGRYEGMMFVKVLKDFLDKELFYYAYLNNIKGIQKRYNEDFNNPILPGKGSNETVIKTFLNGLQVLHINL
jgi:tRNA(Ile)-lysidine synthase TilS/MesJ